MLEMFRRDQFRQDLLVERCDELIALDERLQELDTLLAASVSTRRAAPAAGVPAALRSCGARTSVRTAVGPQERPHRW